MSDHPLTQGELVKMVISRFVGALLVTMLMFFLPAGTFQYPEAWVFIGIIFIPLTLVLVYLLKNDTGCWRAG